MDDLTGVIVILCIFVAPLRLIMHYASSRRQAKSLTREDEKCCRICGKQPTGWRTA